MLLCQTADCFWGQEARGYPAHQDGGRSSLCFERRRARGEGDSTRAFLRPDSLIANLEALEGAVAGATHRLRAAWPGAQVFLTVALMGHSMLPTGAHSLLLSARAWERVMATLTLQRNRGAGARHALSRATETQRRRERQIVSWVLNQTARVHSVRPTRERVANPRDLLKVLQADQRYLVFWVS